MDINFQKENKWKRNIVKDENAPLFFSERSINLFALLFGVFFSSIILSINLYKTNKFKEIILVVVFGVLYTYLQVEFLQMLTVNILYTYLFNIGGAFILNNFFWERYIGENTKYREKPIWIPLIVGIIIILPFILAIVYNGVN